jgi:hypothetical protein
VPLLRLAQLASMGKEFQDAFCQRLASQVKAAEQLRRDSLCHMPTTSEEYIVRRTLWRRLVNTVWGTWRVVGSDRGVTLPYSWNVCHVWMINNIRKFSSVSVPFQVNGVFQRPVSDARPHKSLWVCGGEVGHVSVVALKRRPKACEVLILGYGYNTADHLPSPGYIRPWPKPGMATCLLSCMAMADTLCAFLHGGADGSTCDRRLTGGAGAVHSLTFVVPTDMAWPNEAEEAAICDAITCIHARVRGMPSRVRVAVTTAENEHVESSWRLPYSTHGK